MKDEIEVTGHPRWVPVPLGLGPSALMEHLRPRLEELGTAYADPEVAETAAEALVGAARRLESTPPEDGGLNLAAWGLLGDAARSQPPIAAIAALRALPIAADQDIVALLAEGMRLHLDPILGVLETTSGEARTIRLRPMVEVTGETRVHQLTAVVWERPEVGAAVVLSSYGEDLADATEAGDLLEELGRGVDGL